MTRDLVAVDPLRKVKLRKPVRERKWSPPVDAIEQILAAAAQPLADRLAVLAFTGMRSGECQRLECGQMDLAGNWIHIVSRADDPTKTRRSRKGAYSPASSAGDRAGGKNRTALPVWHP
ncbi:MAG: hypothetical protein WD042_05880 [Phycisphaeraceae bacterium]